MKRKVKAASGIRQFYVCEKQRILLAVVYDIIKIYDVDIGAPIHSIKLDLSPRYVRLAPNGNYFAVYQNDGSISIYDTAKGMLLQKIMDAPISLKAIRFSKNSQKLIFASTQILCLWSIRQCGLQIRTQNWKNINCYDVSEDGSQFVIGTYNGIIFMLTYLGDGKCTQIQIKKHKTCIVAICCHSNKIISSSYDGFLLISTIAVSRIGQKVITYNQVKLSVVPRQIESVGQNFYLLDNRGLTWFTSNYTLVGFVDNKPYKPLVNQSGELVFVKLSGTQLQWWPGKIIRGSYNFLTS